MDALKRTPFLLVIGLWLSALPQGAAGSAAQPPLGGFFADSFRLYAQPTQAPRTEFTIVVDGAEQSTTLDDFRGRVILVNFWATWCAPCVEEMPELDNLQALRDERGLTVLTVSNDRGGLNVVEPFYAELGLQHLGIYLDPGARLAQAFGVRGLPTSYLIDTRGQVVGFLEGAAPWDDEDALALVDWYLERSEAE